MLDLSPIIGQIPYRLALAGGWIDQPFVSRLVPGSMVVASIQPTVPFMERCGMATGTRKVARRIWGDQIPVGDPQQLMEQLYRAENESQRDPSGSQDMAGLLFPGISRLDYAGDIFPAHIESCLDPGIAQWLESVIHIIPIAPRPIGYSPLGIQNVTLDLVERLGTSGRQAYEAILAKDLAALGQSFNDTMDCWAAMLPHVLCHPTLTVDIPRLLDCYRSEYPGVMTSGCGGGYLYVASAHRVSGSFQIEVRLS